MSSVYGSVRVVTAPTVEPVTASECKLDARVDGSAEDTLFTSWIATARDEVEKAARRALINRTLELALDRWPADNAILLPYPPLSSVTSIKYYDGDGVEQTFAAENYIAVTDEEPGRILLAPTASWPADLHVYPRIRVRYVAGYGAASSAVPERYRFAIRQLVKNYYDYRSGMTPDGQRGHDQALAYAASEWGW